MIAAGTTVTEDVPADALAIGRVPQVNRQGGPRAGGRLADGGLTRSKTPKRTLVSKNMPVAKDNREEAEVE